MRVEIAACLLAFSAAMSLPGLAPSPFAARPQPQAVPRSLETSTAHPSQMRDWPANTRGGDAMVERVEFNKSAKDDRAPDFGRLQNIW